MKIINRICLAIKFILMPEYKEKKIIHTRNFMQNHFSEEKKKICIRCKRRESIWHNGECNTCSDIGFLE